MSPEAIDEVAGLVGIEPAQVLGTCSFYTMFKRDGKKQLVVSVCTNVSCLVNGGPELFEALSEQYHDATDVDVEEVECLAACDTAPVFQVNYEFHGKASAESASTVIDEYRSGTRVPARRVRREARERSGARDGPEPIDQRSVGRAPRPAGPGAGMTPTGVAETRIVTKRLREHPEDSWTIDRYLATGGYEMLRQALTMEPAAIQDEQVKASGLRGRGGAGFGTGQKWSFLPKGVYPRYLAVNGDEGEPSTFKDHMLLEGDPHQILEGVVIAAFAIEAHHAFIYVRGEFALGIERLEQAVRDAYAKGFVGKNILGSGFDLEVVVHRGAGAYIAGDETGLLSSLEGERAMPRIKPPFPAVQGLYAQPTVVNNVETLSTVPHILRMGGEEYAKLGVGRSTGTRIFSVSGHVERPGNYEVELGISFRDLIEGLAGGVRGGKQMKFFIPGGASAPWLMPEHLDAPLDMDYVGSELKTMLGSGAIMVFDEDTNPALVVWRLLKFFAHESCGKCTPCREGSIWLERVLFRISHGLGRPQDLDLMLSFGATIVPGLNAPFSQTTICAMGPSTMSAVVSLDRFFREEILEMCSAAATRTSIPVAGA